MKGLQQGALVEYRAELRPVLDGFHTLGPGIVIRNSAPECWGGTDYVHVQFNNEPRPKWVRADNLRKIEYP